jgi:hypothetical protein
MVRTGFILSVVSGALFTIQGLLHVIRTQWALELGLGEFRRHSLRGIDFKVLGIVTIILGIVVLLGAYLLRKPGRERQGGITVIAFSVLSIFTGGGYLVGVLLGVIGGALALTHYQPKEQPLNQTTQQ